MAKSAISYRVSFSAILFFILAVFGVSLPVLFACAGLTELVMAGILLSNMHDLKGISSRTVLGYLAVQYVDGNKIDPIAMIHMAGARVLACSLGLFAVGWYIPTILIYLSTCVDIKYKKR